MRKPILLMVIIIIAGFFNLSMAQDSTSSIAQSRKNNLIKLLNYRFKGGYYTFEKVFNQSIKYPEAAKGNCVMGTVIISFRVSCKGEVYDVKNKTPMGFGIENEISSFFTKTQGQWNDCKDEKYTKFEIPIQFKILGTETKTGDALLLIEEENPGYSCNGDEYYLNKINKYIEKDKIKKALPFIKIMCQRDPYNSYYRELKTKALGFE